MFVITVYLEKTSVQCNLDMDSHLMFTKSISLDALEFTIVTLCIWIPYLFNTLALKFKQDHVTIFKCVLT